MAQRERETLVGRCSTLLFHGIYYICKCALSPKHIGEGHTCMMSQVAQLAWAQKEHCEVQSHGICAAASSRQTMSPTR